MDEKTFLSIIQVFGDKIYHLHVGFATMFNLCLSRGVFAESQFHSERAKVEAFPDLAQLRGFLAALHSPTDSEAIEEFLRNYKGPVQ
ncbi:MAG TPA: hypothetical protein VK335_17485 [Bryobacteraceae bacterium]|nr:hypothetical protein [Bryobacteraceae bacterium]